MYRRVYGPLSNCKVFKSSSSSPTTCWQLAWGVCGALCSSQPRRRCSWSLVSSHAALPCCYGVVSSTPGRVDDVLNVFHLWIISNCRIREFLLNHQPSFISLSVIRGDTKEFQMWPAVYHIWSCGIDDHIWHRLLRTKAPGESQVWVKLTLKQIQILPQISLKSFFSIKVGKKSSLHLKSFTSGLWECPVSLLMLLCLEEVMSARQSLVGGSVIGDAVLFLFQGLGGEPGPVPVHSRGLRLTVRPAHADFEPRSAGSPFPDSARRNVC